MALLSALGSMPGRLQRLGGIGPAHRQRQQQLLDGDERVAGLLGHLLGLVEQARGLGRHVELAGAAALDLGLLLEQLLGRRCAALALPPAVWIRLAAMPSGSSSSTFEQMLGQEALVAFAQGQALRRLQEALGAVGVLFHVHVFVPFVPRASGPCRPGPRRGVRPI